MSCLTILMPGQLTTVQDLGRCGHGTLGVSLSGAADTLSLMIGNRLLGNIDNAAALEMTFVGAAVRFDTATRIALVGAPAPNARLATSTRPLKMWQPVDVHAGDELDVGPFNSCMRAYLCVAGGIATPTVLGSRSTHVPTGLGNPTQSLIAAGDRFPLGTPPNSPSASVQQEPLMQLIRTLNRRTLRIVLGPHADLLPASAWQHLITNEWKIGPHTDRMGTRLSGPALTGATVSMHTEGTFNGAIQITPSGQPIVLGPDCAPTGGYPLLASVIATDLHAIAQRRPGDTIRFLTVSLADAHHLARERATLLDCAVQPQQCSESS